MLRHILEHHGYGCAVAGDAREARRVMEKNDYVLALLDINLPGESGLDLAKYVRCEYPDTGMFMVTGVDDPQVARVAMDLGVHGYLVKPFEPNELLINVSGALRRHNLEIKNRTQREMLEQELLVQAAALNEINGKERRSSFRVPISPQSGLRASVKVHNKVFPAGALNISMRGALLEIRDSGLELPVGTRVSVKLQLETHEAQTAGLVCWETGQCYGFFFPDAQDSLRVIVNELERRWLQCPGNRPPRR